MFRLMLFLLNDAILNLQPEDLDLPLDHRAMMSMRTDIITGLCAEMFSANPVLHRTDTGKARRVAALVIAKAPEVNAALFVPAAPGCPVSQVTCRFAQLTFDVLSNLMTAQTNGQSTTAYADEQVWRRLAS